MNWTYLRKTPWIDTRARFVAGTPHGGNLLDLGSSDGDTLNHFAELRPDLRFYAADIAGAPERYPPDSQFHRCDLANDRLPWPDALMDAITCMHLVEHLEDLTLLFAESWRLLKPGGRLYIETPHPKTLVLSSLGGTAAGTFTVNFFDDLSHVRPVTLGGLAQHARKVGLDVVSAGASRNWLFAAMYPLLLFCSASRQRNVAKLHWLGWSAYMIARRAK